MSTFADRRTQRVNVKLDAQQVILETSLSKQSIALVLTTKQTMTKRKRTKPKSDLNLWQINPSKEKPAKDAEKKPKPLGIGSLVRNSHVYVLMTVHNCSREYCTGQF